MGFTLAHGLRAGESKCIAFIGSGGKTTALFQLAKQLKPPVIVTTTSHLGIWQLSLANSNIIAHSQDALTELDKNLNGVVLITGGVDGDRAQPVNNSVLDRIRQFCRDQDIPLLIEADGSRQKPLKGWSVQEPPIPEFVDHVVTIAGLSGLGKPLTEEYVHRPELFAEIARMELGATIDSDALTRALLHNSSGFKNTPSHARRTVLLNQADSPELQASARAMSQALLTKFGGVIISSLAQEKVYAVHEPVSGVILAAGESSRYGSPKQLLGWKGEPFVRAVAHRALEAQLSPVVVVSGANAEQVESTVMDLNVQIVRNNEWKSGQASSIRAGISSLATQPQRAGAVGACIFLLVDQPQLTTSILQALIEKHAEGLASVVAPLVLDRRANPVLFDRRTFSDLLSLEGDVGGRAIFHKHRVEYLPWHDDRLLLDVDTPEHYQRLLNDETL